MIDLKTLRSLVKLMVDNDLTQVDLEDDKEKVKLRRGGPENGTGPVQVFAPQQGAASPAAVGGQAAPVEGAEVKDAKKDDGLVEIASPMVGTFYEASSPEAGPFVGVGDKVSPDDVVCIVEAMKVFNEIKAEASGTVAEILVENGQAVEYGQPLFKLRSA